MSFLSIGDLAQSFQIRRQTTQLKAALARHGQELTSGRVSDTSRALRGDYSALSGIEHGSARLAAFDAVIRETEIHVGGQQSRLAAIMDDGARTAGQLAAVGDGAPAGIVDAVAASGRSAFDAAVSGLNASAGGRALFAGKASGGAALAPAHDILASLKADIAGATTPGELESAVFEWFVQPGSGFDGAAHMGSASELGPIRLSPDDSVSLPGSAARTEIRAHLAGLALAAVVDGGALEGDVTARGEVLRRAGARITESQPGLVRLSAEIGATEARIDRIATRNAAETTALEFARQDLLGADPFESAMRLEETRVRLETMFAVTARLSSLSMSEHLR